MTDGEIINRIRKANKIKCCDLAKKLGVSRSYLAKIISGDRMASRLFIHKFKMLFPNVDTNIFFENKCHKRGKLKKLKE